MTDDSAVWRSAYDSIIADQALLGREGWLKFAELERRARLASRLQELGVESSGSVRRNIRLFQCALMRRLGVRSWKEAQAAHIAPRPGDHEWSATAREAELLNLLEPCWPRPGVTGNVSGSVPVALPPPAVVDSAPVAPAIPSGPVPFNAATHPANEDGSFGPLTMGQHAELIRAGRLRLNGRPPWKRKEY